MSRVLSPVTGKPYGLAAVCRVWQLARSGVYRHLSTAPPPLAQRRGPRGAMSDEALTTAIRGVLAASPFHGEGCWCTNQPDCVKTRCEGFQRPLWCGRIRHGTHSWSRPLTVAPLTGGG